MKSQLTELARKLRKNQTESEAKLWSKLRSRRFADFKFIRQHPIDKYIVDFCCRQKKLIIELDGSQHNESKSIKADRIRDKYLKSKGYRILRIWNYELVDNIDGVMDEIYYQLTHGT